MTKWPGVGMTTSDSQWASPVNVLTTKFHAQGDRLMLLNDPLMTASDPLQMDSQASELLGFGVVRVAETKFKSFWSSAEHVDDRCLHLRVLWVCVSAQLSHAPLCCSRCLGYISSNSQRILS